MSIDVTHGGAPTPAEAAAIAAAAAAVIDEERRASAVDPTPTAYTSPWRAAALREGLRAPLEPPARR